MTFYSDTCDCVKLNKKFLREKFRYTLNKKNLYYASQEHLIRVVGI